LASWLSQSPPTQTSGTQTVSPTATTGVIDPESLEYKNWEINMEKHNKWLQVNDVAQGLILGAVEFAQRQHIDQFPTSEDMWNHLHNLYVTQQGSTNVHYYLQELYSIKWDGYSSISDHIGNVLSIHQKIMDSGQIVDETLVVHTLLSSFPPLACWDVIKQSLLSHGTSLTLDIVSSELLSAYECISWDSDKKTRQLALYSNEQGSQNSYQGCNKSKSNSQ
jgi:gag-polypeptide of LTR copia-type